MSILSNFARSFTSDNTFFRSLYLVLGGINVVSKNHFGSPPAAYISFAHTSNTYFPIFSESNVIGSDETNKSS